MTRYLKVSCSKTRIITYLMNIFCPLQKIYLCFSIYVTWIYVVQYSNAIRNNQRRGFSTQLMASISSNYNSLIDNNAEKIQINYLLLDHIYIKQVNRKSLPEEEPCFIISGGFFIKKSFQTLN